MMYEMRKGKPESTLLLTPIIINLPHHVGVVLEELGFDDAVSYTQQWKSKLSEVIDSTGNRTTNIQIRSPTSRKKSQPF